VNQRSDLLTEKEALTADIPELNLPFDENFTYSSGEYVFEGAKLKFKGQSKYCLNVSNANGDKIGYVSFFVYPDEKKVRMAGMRVEFEHRGKNMSYFLLNELERVASAAGMDFVDTTTQRKPHTCAVLIKHGFKPEKDIIDSRRVFFGRTLEGNAGIFFEDPINRDRFGDSKLMNTQRLTMVDCMEELRDRIAIALNMRYKRP
jgi:GNAT superfamily N-acetyltransferase